MLGGKRMYNNCLISVLMSTYNESVEYVKKSLDSIKEQSYQNLQIILVVDNPENIEVIKYIQECAKKDKRIQIIKNDINRGLVYSLNKALSVAKGEYCARMDADDIADKKRFEVQLSYLKKNNLDLIGSFITDIDENDKEIHGVTKFPESNSSIIEYLKYGSPLPHPTWFGKKSVFKSLHGYQNIDACEDYDFLCRAALKGYRLGCVQKSLLKYRININGISSTKRSIQKTALYYISKQYKNGKLITAKELQRFVNSDEGIAKKASLEKYYKMSENLKKKTGVSYYIYGAYLFVICREARNVIYKILTCKRINKTK